MITAQTHRRFLLQGLIIVSLSLIGVIAFLGVRLLTKTNTDTRSSAVALTNIYVNPSGNDNNNGNSAVTPFKTIQHALDVAQPGTIINLAQGVYKETLTTKANATSTAPIIIRGTDNAKSTNSRRKTVLYGTSRIVNINHSYYQFEGFTIDGQEAIADKIFPTDLSQVIPFKNANRSLIKDGRLIYIGSADTSRDITGIKINNMYLRGGGGECIRIRNNANHNEVINSVIEYCGMFAKSSGDRFLYHNGEGVYIGTSPKSTDQPMHANDTSNFNVVRNNIIYTYGSECFNIKENAHDNSFTENECRYNLEPLEFDGSNVELRGDHNTVSNNTISFSEGWNLKLRSDSSTYDKGGNSIQNNIFSNAKGANIHTEQKAATFCGNKIDSTVEGIAVNIVITSCDGQTITTTTTPVPSGSVGPTNTQTPTISTTSTPSPTNTTTPTIIATSTPSLIATTTSPTITVTNSLTLTITSNTSMSPTPGSGGLPATGLPINIYLISTGFLLILLGVAVNRRSNKKH